MFQCLSDLNNLTCRTCLIVGSDMKSLCENKESTNIMNMLSSITNQKISEDDGMPVNICLNCLLKVEEAFKFKQLCEQSYSTLQNRILLFKNETFITSQKTDEEDSISNENINEVVHINDVCIKSDYEDGIDLSQKASLTDKESNCRPDIDAIKDIKSNEISNSILEDKNQSTNEDNTFNVIIQPVCEYCNKKFCNKYYLKVHLNKVHNKSATINPSVKFLNTQKSTESYAYGNSKFSCKDCEKAFKKLVSLNLHRRVHQPGYTKYRHQCTYCGKLFERPADCREHTRTHTGEQPFQCTHCSKRYSHRKSLYFHMIKHSEEKYVVCPVCGKRLASRGCLDAHMKTHDGVRNHKCSECMKAFYFKSQLSVHMRQHTGEKPYICSSCEATFATSGQLKCHLRKHAL